MKQLMEQMIFSLPSIHARDVVQRVYKKIIHSRRFSMGSLSLLLPASSAQLQKPAKKQNCAVKINTNQIIQNRIHPSKAIHQGLMNLLKKRKN